MHYLLRIVGFVVPFNNRRRVLVECVEVNLATMLTRLPVWLNSISSKIGFTLREEKSTAI